WRSSLSAENMATSTPSLLSCSAFLGCSSTPRWPSRIPPPSSPRRSRTRPTISSHAGSVWPEAYYYGMCILEEMQWIRTRPVHAGDFFHGTLELVEQGVSVFVFKGEDASRPLSDRVENFAKRYSDRVRVLDAAAVELPGISPQVRSLISPILLATL